MREVNIQSSILVPIFFALHEQSAHKHQDNCCFGQLNRQTQLKMDPHNEQVLSLLFMALVKHLMGITQALISLLEEFNALTVLYRQQCVASARRLAPLGTGALLSQRRPRKMWMKVRNTDWWYRQVLLQYDDEDWKDPSCIRKTMRNYEHRDEAAGEHRAQTNSSRNASADSHL